MTPHGTRLETLTWRLALACFTLAALTGAFMRFGMYLGFPGGLQFADVRHAHSHLMFFSWATPALALAANAALARVGRRLPGGAAIAAAAALAGLVAYVPFLLSGYRLMSIGDAEMPLSMMASGLNGIVWYALAALYLAGSWRAVRTPAIRLMDGAITMLLVSTLGVFLLMVEGMSGTSTPASVAANADLFLTLFADGWFGLGLLAALALSRFPAAPGGFGAATWSLVAGLTVRSLARLIASSDPAATLRAVETAGGLVAAGAWLWLVLALWRSQRDEVDTTQVVARLALALVGLKALVESLLALPAGQALVEREGLRVLLLHAFLLGAVTFGLASFATAAFGRTAWRGLTAFTVAVAVMIACLLPLTGLWPAALGGPWTLRAAAYSSLLPALLGGYAFAGTFVSRAGATTRLPAARHQQAQPS